MFSYLPPLRFVCLEFESRRAGRFLSHITIFKEGRGKREGGRGGEEAQDWIKREGNPLPPSAIRLFYWTALLSISLPELNSARVRGWLFGCSHLCSVSLSLFACLSSISRVPLPTARKRGEEKRRIELLFMHRKRERETDSEKSGKNAHGKQGCWEVYRNRLKGGS